MITTDIEYAFENGEPLYTYEELAEYSEGDVVSVGGDTGVITAVMKSSFNFPTGDDEVEEVEASGDKPVYVVATGDGAVAVTEDELSEDNFDSDEDVDPKKLAGDAEMSSIYREMDNPDNYEELLNIRGVDDPEVGFSSLPKGWDRTSVLKAWASLGGTWTSCRTEMTGDIRSPKRFCAALKDEVLQTESWRNRF